MGRFVVQAECAMQTSRITFAVLLFVMGMHAQNEKTSTQPPPAVISCSAHVPTDTCKWVTSVFSLHQLSSSMRQVEIVIDDKQAFLQESERLREESHEAAPNNPAHRELTRRALSSPYDDSLLFELGEEGFVTRVVVSIGLFSKVKFVPDSSGVPYATSTGELDRDAVNSWAFYITGYVEGSRRSRLYSVTENSEKISDK
jgi:hypothetical protein